MSKRIAQTLAELVVHLGDALLRRQAVRANVAAVFDKRELDIVRTEKVIALGVHQPVDPIATLFPLFATPALRSPLN
jgi:hypothetical protein